MNTKKKTITYYAIAGLNAYGVLPILPRRKMPQIIYLLTKQKNSKILKKLKTGQPIDFIIYSLHMKLLLGLNPLLKSTGVITEKNTSSEH